MLCPITSLEFEFLELGLARWCTKHNSLSILEIFGIALSASHHCIKKHVFALSPPLVAKRGLQDQSKLQEALSACPRARPKNHLIWNLWIGISVRSHAKRLGLKTQTSCCHAKRGCALSAQHETAKIEWELTRQLPFYTKEHFSHTLLCIVPFFCAVLCIKFPAFPHFCFFMLSVPQSK